MGNRNDEGKAAGYASATTVTLSKAHDVLARGQENDRVQRRESYVKDFKEIKIGKIKLNKGKGELALQALDIPGEESIEFRLLMLEKVQ